MNMIGFFDSGVGGLSVLAEVMRALPSHATQDFIYLADTAHIPYGNKSSAFIRDRVILIGQYLVDHGCSCVVVACNTATAAAIQDLRSQHPHIPIIGVEPGVKPAALTSLSKKIAILTTESTAKSARLAALIHEHAQGVHVEVVACPGWATWVERMQDVHTSLPSKFNEDIEQKIEPLLLQGVDRLVLGCTHYSFLRPFIEKICQSRAEIVDVATAVARQVLRLYPPTINIHSPPIHPSTRVKLWATATPEKLLEAFNHFGLPGAYSCDKVFIANEFKCSLK